MALNPNSNATLEVSDQAEYFDKLENAPIAEFAKYVGVDIDLAVQLRIDEAVSNTYDKIRNKQGVIAKDIYNDWKSEIEQSSIEVTARPIEPKGNLLGFASVKIGDITIDDFKIVSAKNGDLFVSMPSKPDSKSETGYRNTVRIDKDFRSDFTDAVLSAHLKAVKLLPELADKHPEMVKLTRIKDQISKASENAEKYNVKNPTHDKPKLTSEIDR